jgi:hypothetical protein
MKIQAYSIKQKKKVDMVNPVIHLTPNNKYMAKGQDDQGNNVVAIMSKVNAEAAVATGIPKNGW